MLKKLKTSSSSSSSAAAARAAACSTAHQLCNQLEAANDRNTSSSSSSFSSSFSSSSSLSMNNTAATSPSPPADVTTPDTKPNEPTASYYLNDYVYIETSKSEPFEIGQIDAIIQKRSGAYELRVRTLLRRQDVPIVLILSTEREYKLDHIKSNEDGALQELYYNTSYTKSCAPQQLRGKCVVVRFEPGIDDPKSFVNQKDTFFYRLKYKLISNANGGSGNGSSSISSLNGHHGNGNNGHNNNGLAHQQPFLFPLEEGSMRIGTEYQAVVPPFTLSASERAVHYRNQKVPEELRYTPNHKLTDEQIDTFITVCRSLGAFGRTQMAMFAGGDTSSSSSNADSPPNAINVAASSSRDYTTQCAMDVLHSYDYDIAAATHHMVPNGRPAICMESDEKWTEEAVTRFNEGFGKVGKNFRSLRTQFLPDKELSSIITYYYKWKKCGRITPPRPSSPMSPLSPLKANGNGGGGGGGRTTLYNGKQSNVSSALADSSRPLGSKRKLKSIAIPERLHNTADGHARSPEMSRRCDSCLVTTHCRKYPCGMLDYVLCHQCRGYWQRLASFRIL